MNTILGWFSFPLSMWLLVAFVPSILIICASGKLLSKAEEPWWYILIPFFGIYKIYAIADSVILYWASILSIIINILAFLVHDGYTWVSWLLSFGTIILYVLFSLNLANAFNKSKKFAIGIIFLPGIFMCILAYGSAYHVDTMLRHRWASASNS